MEDWIVFENSDRTNDLIAEFLDIMKQYNYSSYDYAHFRWRDGEYYAWEFRVPGKGYKFYTLSNGKILKETGKRIRETSFLDDEALDVLQARIDSLNKKDKKVYRGHIWLVLAVIFFSSFIFVDLLKEVALIREVLKVVLILSAALAFYMYKKSS